MVERLGKYAQKKKKKENFIKKLSYNKVSLRP